MYTSHQRQHKALDQEILESYHPNQQILRCLETFVSRKQCSRDQVRILDFGCGRGELCLFLRNLGYDVYGADIDQSAIGIIRRFVEEQGDDPDRFRIIDENGVTSFPDAFFDFIISDQVLEHVEDMSLAARECARLTRAGGCGIHSYPAPYTLIEPHIFVPFVHWMPKSRIRFYWIFLCLFFKQETPWDHLKGLSRWKLARYYFDYLHTQTFYRNQGAIQAIFGQHGFHCKQIVIRHPKIADRNIFRKLTALPGVTPVMTFILSSFVQSDLWIERRAEPSEDAPCTQRIGLVKTTPDPATRPLSTDMPVELRSSNRQL